MVSDFRLLPLVVLQSVILYVLTGLYTPLQGGLSPLFIASQGGHTEVVHVLVKNGVDINQPKNVGKGLTYGTLIMYVHHFIPHTGWYNTSVHS